MAKAPSEVPDEDKLTDRMKYSPLSIVFGFVLLAFGLALCAPLQAAMLGEMQVRSALGERFQASISVAGADDESLSSNCFRLVSPQQLGDGAPLVLHRARLVYQPDDEHSGQLIIYGDDKIDEPLLNVAVRVKCPDEDRRVFQRDYNVLLDPREYAAPPQAETRLSERSESSSRRSRPALGSIWLSREGDRVDQIAKIYYPRDKANRARFTDALYLLNPDLPQGTQVRLPADIQIRLPDRASVQPEPVREPARVMAQPRQPSPIPALRIEGNSIEALPAPVPVEENRTSVGEGFQLRLSAPVLDTSRKSNLTPEESLRVREHLLVLSSDDQTAQLLQLKYQISELEKQLLSIKPRGSDVEGVASGLQASRPISTDENSAWWWLIPILLVGSVLVWLYRRWRLRREYEEAESFSFATNLDTRSSVHNTQLPEAGFTDTSLGMRELVHNIARAANDFRNTEVDVVQPNNVSEEAQLLIDHGLIQQALNLLDHELNQHPTALALWMKLFDIQRQQGMKQAFQERAVAFRLQFASDALWQQVQAIGRQLDSDNPLYRSLDDQPDDLLALSTIPALPVQGQDALDFASLLHEQAGLTPLGNAAEATTIATPALLAADDTTQVSLPELTFGFDELEPSKQTAAPEIANIDLKLFVSDDPHLQQIAKYLLEQDLDTAFHLLEETLYHGTLEQRMTAMKWLDKLAPARDS